MEIIKLQLHCSQLHFVMVWCECSVLYLFFLVFTHEFYCHTVVLRSLVLCTAILLYFVEFSLDDTVLWESLISIALQYIHHTSKGIFDLKPGR